MTVAMVDIENIYRWWLCTKPAFVLILILAVLVMIYCEVRMIRRNQETMLDLIAYDKN